MRKSKRYKKNRVGRSTRHFANTAGWAQTSAVLFSLIETAKENGLDPYRYLTWLLNEAPRKAAVDPS